MRSAEDIARDLIAAKQMVEYHQTCNIAGKDSKTLEQMRAAWMEAERKLSRLKQEERDWIDAAPSYATTPIETADSKKPASA